MDSVRVPAKRYQAVLSKARSWQIKRERADALLADLTDEISKTLKQNPRTTGIGEAMDKAPAQALGALRSELRRPQWDVLGAVRREVLQRRVKAAQTRRDVRVFASQETDISEWLQAVTETRPRIRKTAVRAFLVRLQESLRQCSPDRLRRCVFPQCHVPGGAFFIKRTQAVYCERCRQVPKATRWRLTTGRTTRRNRKRVQQ